MNKSVCLFIFSIIICSCTSTKDKDKPILTTASIIHVCPDNRIALIERGKKPKGIAMFGGHVEGKESPIQAFRRELKEELNITQVRDITLVGVYGNYGRDPRQHSVEITYSCITHQKPHAGSDAKSVTLYDVDVIKSKLQNNGYGFAFDHRKILQNYFEKLGSCDPCQEKCKH